ncbi:MAG: hypothetical protein QM727_03010 [Niabella sp.]
MDYKSFCLLIFLGISHFLYGQTEDAVKKAIQLGDAQRFDDAITLLKTEIKNNPNNAEAYYWIGRYAHYLVYDSRPFLRKSNEWSKTEVLANLNKAIQLNNKLGDAYYFLAVEYGCRAREAIQNRDIIQAKKELLAARKAGAFPDYMLEYARSILNSCEQNAILFSNRDAAVNALMFVQLIEGVRKDISLVVVNLLERPFYIKYMRDGIPDEIEKVPISWSDNLIMNMYSYFPWKEQPLKIKISPQRKKEYNIPDSINNIKLLVKDKYGSGSMWIGTAAILNIFENNKFERPIYCALPSDDDMFEFTDYLQNEGFVSKLMPYKVKGTAKEYDRAKFESSMLNADNYRDFADVKVHSQPRANYFFCDNRRNIILDYVQFLISLNEKEKAKVVYSKMNLLMPALDCSLSSDILERCKKMDKQLLAE